MSPKQSDEAREADIAYADAVRAQILSAHLAGELTEVEVLRGLVQWIGYDGWQIPDAVYELARLYGGNADGGPWEPPPTNATYRTGGQSVSLPPLPPRAPLPPAQPVFDRLLREYAPPGEGKPQLDAGGYPL